MRGEYGIVSLTEVQYIKTYDDGVEKARRIMNAIQRFPISWIHSDAALCASAAELKAAHTISFADAFVAAGFKVLNDVVLNQVLVSFGEPEHTRKVIAAIQEDGTCWCGPTVWHGQTAMRVSVISWLTTEEDVDLSIETILRLARS